MIMYACAIKCRDRINSVHVCVCVLCYQMWQYDWSVIKSPDIESLHPAEGIHCSENPRIALF